MINDLNKSVEKIHNYIYANDGLDNHEVLNELLKILYLKTYDELNLNLLNSSNNDYEIIKNVDIVFKQLIVTYPTLFDENSLLSLKKETLIYIIKELKDYNISKMGSDVKGHLMQRIIDRSFREGRGQFFTPAQVVDFIVEMIEPRYNEIGCDPACGTGGFMFSALEKISEETTMNMNDIIKNIDFYDISKSVIKLIKMRLMFEFSIDDSNIKIQDSISSEFYKEYDYVLSNPPFGTQGRISDKKILSKFYLGQDEKGKPLSSQVPDILFVEKIINILKDGGRAAIVLPDGNFENPSSRYFREFLVRNCKIDAIVSLPDGTFIPYGTGVKSSILFISKKQDLHLNYDIFFGKITALGYSFSKHSKTLYDRNGNVIEDTKNVLDAFKNKKYDDINFIININKIIENNYNFSYNFYSPKLNNEILSHVKDSKILLKDLVSYETKKAKISLDDTYRYIEISDVNATGCEIINCSLLEGSELPSRASYILKKDQIIVAIAGNAIGTIWNTKAIVTDEFEGCICTNGFIVLNSLKWSPYLLLHFFNTEAFRSQVRKYKYGTAIPTISRDDFMNIVVPNYSEELKEKIIENMKKAFILKDQIKKLLNTEN